jgi:hypothetical protein
MAPKTGHNSGIPETLRKYFWDVAYEDLSLEKYPKFIAERILNFGDLDAVKWLQSVLDKDFIRSVIINSRNLNPKTKNYWKLMLGESGS